MLVSLDARLAYLAVPKTATQALEAALAPRCDIRFGGPPQVKHMNMRTFQRFVLPYLQRIGAGDIETFCVVREPVDWLGSWYRYRTREGLIEPAKGTRGLSFAGFVEAYLAEPQPAYARLGGLARFVAGSDGRPAVTHIYRYENLSQAVAFLGERLGRRIELPQINVSPSRSDLALPPALRARLEAERAADFALYAELAR